MIKKIIGITFIIIPILGYWIFDWSSFLNNIVPLILLTLGSIVLIVFICWLLYSN